MKTFQAKDYQRSCLESISKYFVKCQEMGNADYAFQETTEELWGEKSHYTPLAGGFPKEMPYFCLRVPTGGGKTWLAATRRGWSTTIILSPGIPAASSIWGTCVVLPEPVGATSTRRLPDFSECRISEWIFQMGSAVGAGMKRDARAIAQGWRWESDREE